MPTLLTLLLTLLALTGCRSRAPAAEAEPPHVAATPAISLASPAISPATPDPSRALGPGVAVVELFTSEGCSSCPAADETLAEITTEAERAGSRVYTLELHVDYWTQLGWADPYSAAIHSERQGGYSRALGLNGSYTPQMIVNGREELVGSRGALARAAISRALARPSSVGVKVAGTRSNDSPSLIRVAYQVKSSAPVLLQLALAEDTAETAVERGENAGRRLKHRHVTRAFWTRRVQANASGSWDAPWPASARSVSAYLVAYAADPATRAVIGADAQSLGVPH